MPWKDAQSSRLHHLFLEGFSAMDIAEPKVSFDAQTVRAFMLKKGFDLVCIRVDGLITLGEMLMTEIINHRYIDDSWQDCLSVQRLVKARKLQKQRLSRGQRADRMATHRHCLQPPGT